MERIYGIDVLRGLAIVSVVLTHTYVYEFLGLGYFPPNWFRCLIAFTIPSFFFISGFGLTQKYKDEGVKDLKKYFKQRFNPLIFNYLFWAFLLLIMFNLINLPNVLNYENNIQTISLEKINSIEDFIIKYIISVLTGCIDVLWFIFVIFQFYIIFPFLIKKYNKMKKKSRHILIIVTFIATSIYFLLGNIILSDPFTPDQIKNIFIFLRTDVIIFTFSTSVNRVLLAQISYLLSINFEGFSFEIIFNFLSLIIENNYFKINISNFFHLIPFLIYFLMGMHVSFYWKDLKNKLNKSKFLRIIIYLFFTTTLITITIINNIIFPLAFNISGFFTIGRLFHSITSIFFFLLIISQKNIFKKIDTVQINSSGVIIKNKNDNFKSNTLYFEGNKLGRVNRFFWVVGEYSTGIYLIHRAIMFIVIWIFYLCFQINLVPDQSHLNGIESFIYAVLLFLLVFNISWLFVFLIWKIPKNKYLLGKRSSLLDLKRRVIP